VLRWGLSGLLVYLGPFGAVCSLSIRSIAKRPPGPAPQSVAPVAEEKSRSSLLVLVRGERLSVAAPDACLPMEAAAPATYENWPSRTRPRGVVRVHHSSLRAREAAAAAVDGASVPRPQGRQRRHHRRARIHPMQQQPSVEAGGIFCHLDCALRRWDHLRLIARHAWAGSEGGHARRWRHDHVERPCPARVARTRSPRRRIPRTSASASARSSRSRATGRSAAFPPASSARP
jgi:hypothetical protein